MSNRLAVHHHETTAMSNRLAVHHHETTIVKHMYQDIVTNGRASRRPLRAVHMDASNGDICGAIGSLEGMCLETAATAGVHDLSLALV